MRDRKIKVIGKGASASAVLAKYNGEEFILKEMLCKHWDEKGKKNSKGGQNSYYCVSIY